MQFYLSYWFTIAYTCYYQVFVSTWICAFYHSNTCTLFLFLFFIYRQYLFHVKFKKLKSEHQFTSGRIRILQVTGTESPFTSVVRIWNRQLVYWDKYRYTTSISLKKNFKHDLNLAESNLISACMTLIIL